MVGEGAYANASAAPETTAVNDAGLIAYQLQQAGFDVTGGRDVDRTGFESLAATFFAKLGQAGPNAVAVIYVSGIGLQADGDNRIIPTDAKLANLDAIGVETISVNELLAQLQSVPGAAHIAIFDLARPLPFRIAPQVAPGLAALDPQQGLLVALSQQPGYVIEEQKQGYGAFASALAEMIRVPGLSLDELFARTRLRVQEETQGRPAAMERLRPHERLHLLHAREGRRLSRPRACGFARSAARPASGRGCVLARDRARHDRRLSGVHRRLPGRASREARARDHRGAGARPFSGGAR